MPVVLPPKFQVDPMFKMLSIQELLDLPAPVYLIEGLIPENAVCLLTGVKGTYKSFMALDMALTMTHGIGNFHGHAAQTGGVIYFAGEGGGGFGQRVHAWRQFHKYDKQHLSPFWLVREPMKILDPDNVDMVVRTIKDAETRYNCQFRLMVTDTMSRAFQGEKEDEQNWGSAILMQERIKERVGHGLATLGIAHEGKEEGRGTRGSSVADCNADAILRMKSDKKLSPDEISLYVEKLKDDEDGQTFRFVTCKQSWTRSDTGMRQNSIIVLKEDEETDGQKMLRLGDRQERQTRDAKPAGNAERTKKHDWLALIAEIAAGTYTCSNIFAQLGVPKNGDKVTQIRLALPMGETKTLVNSKNKTVTIVRSERPTEVIDVMYA